MGGLSHRDRVKSILPGLRARRTYWTRQALELVHGLGIGKDGSPLLLHPIKMMNWPDAAP
jgi:hypothetical protein